MFSENVLAFCLYTHKHYDLLPSSRNSDAPCSTTIWYKLLLKQLLENVPWGIKHYEIPKRREEGGESSYRYDQIDVVFT